MSRKLKSIAISVTIFGLMSWTNSAFAIDLEALAQQGEVYVVALYETYQSEAKRLEDSGDWATAGFLRARADAVAAGAELAPAQPIASPGIQTGPGNDEALRIAYEETSALVLSEAADVAPAKIAAVQTTYESWFFNSRTMNLSAAARSAQRWQAALDRFVNWSEVPEVVAHNSDNFASTKLRFGALARLQDEE